MAPAVCRSKAAGQLVSDDGVTLTGSDLFVTGGAVDSVLIDSDGASLQVDAGGNILIQSVVSAPPTITSQTIINGAVRTTGAASTISITGERDVLFGADGDVTSVDNAITVTAATGGVNGGVITMADGALISSTSGNIDLSADGNVTLGGLSTTTRVRVTSVNGAILDGGDTLADITAATAALRALTGIGDAAGGNGALESAASGGSLTLAAVTDSGDIQVTNTGTLIIDTVDGLPGVAITDTANNNSGNDHIVLIALSPLTVSQPVTNNDGGNITLTASGALATDNLTISAALTITGGDAVSDGDGNVTLNAGNSIFQNAGGNISVDGAGALDYNAGTGTATGVITQVDATTSVTATGLITMDADGDITIANVQTGNTTNAAVTVTSTAGGIVDGGATNVDIIANSGRVVINAVTGVGNGGAIETTAGSLDIDNATSGNIEINETDAVTIFDAQEATAGNIIINANGTITIDNAAAVANAVSTVGAGTIEINANGVASNLVVNDGVQSVSGSITLTADNNVTFDADGDVTSTSGNVTVTADHDTGAGASGALFMADGTVINAGAALIDLNADENITVGQLITTSASLLAVTIDSTEGALVDGGDTGGADIDALNGRVVINTVTGIGSGNAIETRVDSLDLDNTVSGDIEIIETDAVTVFHAQQAAAGNISIAAGGTITVSELTGAVVTVISTFAGTVLLDANGATSDIVLNDVTISASSVTLTADRNISTNADGDITSTALTATADVLAGNNGSTITMADGALWNAGAGLIDLDADGNITLGGLLTTGEVQVTTTNGAIIDGGSAHVDITALTAALRAATGIGSGNAIEAIIGTLAAENTTSGDISLDNVLSTGLTIGLVNGLDGVNNDNSTNAGVVAISNVGGITVDQDVTSDGAVTLSAIDTATVSNENITITSPRTVKSNLAGVTINAGDNVTIPSGASVRAGAITASATTNITINVDVADADPATGSVVTIGGTLIVGNVNSPSNNKTTITGGVDNDVFALLPQTATPINVDGGAPVAPAGDTLTLDLTGLAAPTLQLGNGLYEGTYFFNTPDTQLPVFYTSIETPPVLPATYHLSLNMKAAGFEDGAANSILMQKSGANLEIYVNGVALANRVFASPISAIRSFQLLGSTDDETLTINDTGGLPVFADVLPNPLNDTPLPPGSARPDNSLLAGTPSVYYAGNGGTDALKYVLSGGTADQTYALGDGVGGGFGSNAGTATGEILTVKGGALDLYFTGLAPITTSGSGGTLTIVGDSEPQLIEVIAADDASVGGPAGFTRIQAWNCDRDGTFPHGYQPYEYFDFAAGAFTALVVQGLGGADIVDLVSLDAGEAAITTVSLQGGGGDDILSTRTTAKSGPGNFALTLDGGDGNDTLNVGTLSNVRNITGLSTKSLDLIGSSVTVTGGNQTDSIVLTDSASATPYTYTVTDTTITRAATQVVSYTTAESLRLVSGTVDDTIKVNSLAGSLPASPFVTSLEDAGGTGDVLDFTSFGAGISLDLDTAAVQSLNALLTPGSGPQLQLLSTYENFTGTSLKVTRCMPIPWRRRGI